MSRSDASRRPGRVAAVAALAGAGVLAASVPGDPAAAGSGSGPDPASKPSRLERALEAFVADPVGPPGVVVVIHRGPDRTVLTAGVANVRSGREIRKRDHMRVASVAKAFSGAVALSLVDRGVLSLRDTIGELLPDLPDDWSDVTLAQLLQHTSGVPDFTHEEAFLDRVISKPHVPLPPRRLLSFVAHKDLGFAPGSRYEYSNSDNIVVALMAQKVTGRPYARLLRRLVADPLHLRRTFLPTGHEMRRPYIHGYEVAAGAAPEDVSELFAAGYAFASGGVVSTPADLDRFIRGYLGAKLFDRSVQEKQLRLVAGSSDPPGPGTNAAGLAVFRYQTRCGTVYGHTGNTAGYTQFAAATLDGRRSVTVSISRQVDEDILPDLRRLETLAVCAALTKR